MAHEEGTTESADVWLRRYVEPVAAIETTHERPWATVRRIPVADGDVWFKACEPVQSFEPRLTAELYERWSDRVSEVLAYDERRGWLLLADAGTPFGRFEDQLQKWLSILPIYAELQQGETSHRMEHLAAGVPDLTVESLPARYEQLLREDLPLSVGDRARFRAFSRGFAELCDRLAEHRIVETVQHDDLHGNNIYESGERLRVLDWGDTSISHPFFSLVVTFRFLEERHGLAPTDPWFTKLRDAYLEPWGRSLEGAFDLALRIGTFAHAFAWVRQRDHLPSEGRADFDVGDPIKLRRAVESS